MAYQGMGNYIHVHALYKPLSHFLLPRKGKAHIKRGQEEEEERKRANKSYRQVFYRLKT